MVVQGEDRLTSNTGLFWRARVLNFTHVLDLNKIAGEHVDATFDFAAANGHRLEWQTQDCKGF